MPLASTPALELGVTHERGLFSLELSGGAAPRERTPLQDMSRAHRLERPLMRWRCLTSLDDKSPG